VSWKTLFGSAAAHAVLFVVLFLVQPLGRVSAVPSSITVNLVNLPRGPVAQRLTAPEPEKTAHGKLEPERTPDRPRDKTIQLDKGQSVKPAPRGAAETTTGPAAVGGAGLTAEVGVDDADFEFTYYLISLRNRIGQNWSAPAGLVTAGKPVRAIVHFRVQRNGAVADARLEESSRIAFFDQSALRAVILSNPLPPLPLGYGGSQLGVHFAFEYTGR
jgi:TonB family protein